MTRLAWLCYAFAAAVATSFIVATTGGMPVEIASHFGLRHARERLDVARRLPRVHARIRPRAAGDRRLHHRVPAAGPSGRDQHPAPRILARAAAPAGDDRRVERARRMVRMPADDLHRRRPLRRARGEPGDAGALAGRALRHAARRRSAWCSQCGSARSGCVSATAADASAARREPARRWPTRRHSCFGSTRQCGPSSSASRKRSFAASTRRSSSCCATPSPAAAAARSRASRRRPSPTARIRETAFFREEMPSCPFLTARAAPPAPHPPRLSRRASPQRLRVPRPAALVRRRRARPGHGRGPRPRQGDSRRGRCRDRPHRARRARATAGLPWAGSRSVSSQSAALR